MVALLDTGWSCWLKCKSGTTNNPSDVWFNLAHLLYRRKVNKQKVKRLPITDVTWWQNLQACEKLKS